MIVNTPSGYKVHLKEYLSYGQSRELQKVLLKGKTINTKKLQEERKEKGKDTNVDVELDALAMYEFQDKAFAFLVEKIEKGEQILNANLYDEVMSWKPEDGNAVMNAVNAIASPTSEVADKNTPEEEKKS